MTDNSTPEPWLDKRGLAEYLACGVRTIERGLTEGMPHTIIYGRVKFRASEVQAWLEANGKLERRGDTVAAMSSRTATQGATQKPRKRWI